MLQIDLEQATYFENFDLETVMSPVDTTNLRRLLVETEYPETKTEWLINSFEHGFHLGYRGPTDVQRLAPNLKLNVGNETIPWNKVMKEVKAKRYAGPYVNVPFKTFIQSPIGLVPKNQGKDTCLIFHLSYPRNGSSVNSETPPEHCSVKYPDFDEAVHRCLDEFESSFKGIDLKFLFIGKSDMRSTFRNLGMSVIQFKFLVMKARSPFDGKWYYFVDKCLPFGAAISCAHFQTFSNVVGHIVQVKIQKKIINYLDDFLFVAIFKVWCDDQIRMFLEVCELIKFLVSMEKAFWGEKCVVFLGLLLDTVNRVVCVPEDKIQKAINLIEAMIWQKNSKMTVKQMEQLCGFLNFLG